MTSISVLTVLPTVPTVDWDSHELGAGDEEEGPELFIGVQHEVVEEDGLRDLRLRIGLNELRNKLRDVFPALDEIKEDHNKCLSVDNSSWVLFAHRILLTLGNLGHRRADFEAFMHC